MSSLHTLKFSNRKLKRVPVADIVREYTAVLSTLQQVPHSALEQAARFLVSLHTNQLHDVPDELAKQCPLISELMLHTNQLRSLPHSVAELQHLTCIALNNNAFESVPEPLYACTRLRAVYLSFNRLRSLPSKLFDAWPDLQVLTLARNQIAALPGNVARLHDLRELNLSGNLLTRLCVELGECAALRSLDVSHNDLAALPLSLGALDKLRTLTTDGCPLAVPPPAVVARGVAAVRRHLSDLHASSQRCLRIKLMLVGSENVGKTTLARALARVAVTHLSSEPTPSLSGSGGAGSSGADSPGAPMSPVIEASSGARRRFPKFSQQSKRLLSTDGIAVETLALDYVPPNGGRVERGALQCLVWDFAGQDLYGATHQFFVSPHSIFLVCFDLRKPESSSSVQHWLETISALVGPNAPVIVVGTHLDDAQCTDERVDAVLDQLFDKYQDRHPGISGYMPVAATGIGLVELRQLVETVAARAPFVGKPMPAPIVTLDAALAHLRATRSPPVMAWSEWLRLTTQCGLGADAALGADGSSEVFATRDLSKMISLATSTRSSGRGSMMFTLASDDVAQATEFLHSLGSLLYFDDASAGLNDVVVLNPGWLAEAFATIVSTKQQFASGGILAASSLAHIWKAPRFPASLHAELLALLARFDLILPLRAQIGAPTPRDSVRDEAGERFVVPFLLPTMSRSVCAQFAQRVSPAIGRYWAFASYVPAGFFGRLLVRIGRICALGGLHCDGFLCGFRAEASDSDKRPTLALVRFAAVERLLRVECGGPRAAALLSVLVEVVDSLTHTWYQVESTAFAPCPHCLKLPALRDAPFLFRHDEVLRAAAANHKRLLCRGVDEVSLASVAPDATLSEVDAKRIGLIEVRILRELARGGFGIVYEAQWRGQIAAVKVMNSASESAHDAAAKFSEFRREVSFMVGLRHPNIVALLAFSLDPCALVMELVTGGDMYSYLHKSPLDAPLDEPLRLKMAWDIAAGMAYLHSNDLVHRDLKSPNILLASNDPVSVCVAKVSDFGLSVRQFDAAVRDGAERSVANPTWLAPETLVRNEFNQASDVFAFGVMLFELQTREHPWAAEQFQFGYQLEEAVIKGRRPLLPLDAEPSLAELTTRAWAANPRERPSFSELCDALTRLATVRSPHIHASRVLSVEAPRIDDLLPDRVLFLNRAAVSPRGRVMSLVVVPAAGHVWCGTEHGFITVFEAVAPGCALFSWRAHDGAVTSLLHAFGSVWSGSEDGSVRVWQCSAECDADAASDFAAGVIDEQVMPQGDALVRQVMSARASAGLSTSESLPTIGADRARRSFVVDAHELVGSLLVLERKSFRGGGWKQRRCELRDDVLGGATLTIFGDDKGGGDAKDVIRLGDSSVVLSGAAAVPVASELKGRPYAFLVRSGDVIKLFDASGPGECERWTAALGGAVARAKRSAELTLLLHVVALPGGGIVKTLARPASDEYGGTIWCVAERPVALHWIDAARGVVRCSLSFGDVFRNVRPSGSGLLCSGAALGVLSSVWLTTDTSVSVCDVRSGRCSARLKGHTGTVLALALVVDEVWSGSRDATIRVWRAADGAPLATLACERSVQSLLHCGRVVWSGGADSSLTLWSVAERTVLLRVQSHSSDVVSSLVAVGERCVWAGSWDGTVSLFTGPAHEWSWRPAAASGARLATASRAAEQQAAELVRSTSPDALSAAAVDIHASPHRANAHVVAAAKTRLIRGASQLRMSKAERRLPAPASEQELLLLLDDSDDLPPLPPLPGGGVAASPVRKRASHEFVNLVEDDEI
jgi:GTPase SAR1 family protein/tRNA A-37 threonylcarbamoyl transferase component Bud32